jgi:hypothetical protein
MKKGVKKLSLSRETVCALQQTTPLKAIRGGNTGDCVTAECGFSWWTCGLSGCAQECTYND